MWTTPRDWAAADKVTSSRMGLVRDALRFLYQPPECRLGGLGSTHSAQSVTGAVDWAMIDFPNTLADNDAMRELSGINQNESAGALIETQTAGHYLASAVVAFDSLHGDEFITPPYPGYSQTLAVAVRSSYTAGRAQAGYVSGPPGTILLTPVVIPVVAAYPCAAGYQWFLEMYAPKESSERLLIRDGRVPYFYLTWIGN